MNRSQKLLAIYTEIRKALGSDISPRDALEAADALIKFVEAQAGVDDRVDYIGRTPFFRLDLQNAFSDGGWSVLEFEIHNGIELPDDNEPCIRPRNEKLVRLLERTA